jgi:hypothetical protein
MSEVDPRSGRAKQQADKQAAVLASMQEAIEAQPIGSQALIASVQPVPDETLQQVSEAFSHVVPPSPSMLDYDIVLYESYFRGVAPSGKPNAMAIRHRKTGKMLTGVAIEDPSMPRHHGTAVDMLGLGE